MPRKKSATPEPSEKKGRKNDPLAPILPGEGTVDEELVDQVVARVNGLWAGKGLETARAIGEYVVETFFKGDPENFRVRGKKHVSFRKLAQREDLYPSYSWIWKAVSVVDQLRLLPENVAGTLPMSHHTLLLPVKDEGTKVELAKKAAEKHLTREQLASEVKKVRARQRKGEVGRPPLPVFVKGLKAVLKAIDLTFSEDVDDEAFDHFDPDNARALLKEVEREVVKLEGLRKKMDKAIEKYEKRAEAE